MTNYQHIKSRLGFTADRPGTLRALTGVWIVVALLNLTVWCFQVAIGASFDTPWFLWSVIPPAIPLAAAWWLTTPHTEETVQR